MNMSGNYCGFMALSVMIIGKLKIYSACSRSRDKMQKMDDKTLRKVLDSNIRLEVHRWPFLGRGRFWDSAPWSCRSLLWWAALGIISQAPDPCLICTLLKSAIPFHTGLFLFSQFQGTNILEQVKPFTQFFSNDWCWEQSCLPARQIWKQRSLAEDQGF